MKKLFLLFLFFMLGFVSIAQIQITSTDVSNLFAVGKSWIRLHSEDPMAMMNLGSPGGTPQNWAMPVINWTDTATIVNLLPASTPYFSYFPNATTAQYSTISYQGYNTTAYEYYQITTNALNLLGSATRIQTGQIDTVIIDTDAETILPMPLTYGATFGNIRDSSSIVPGFWVITNSSQTVDAFGTIALPWNTFDALRVSAIDEIEVYAGGILIDQSTNTYFNWITKNGGIFEADLDTNSATTGTVALAFASLTQVVNTVSVENENNSPSDFVLYQNYPNPFNPATIIKYNIPYSTNVTIRVYDVIGKEIATLVNESKSAGNYEVVFNADNLSSGIYFYKLIAGNVVQTKKMILLR